MRKKLDFVWQRFGRLMVIEEVGRDNHGNVLWRCKCDCGNEVIVRGTDLRKGHTTSCGCLRRDQSTKHGLSVSHCRLYITVYHHFQVIKNEVGCYGDWQIDSRYTHDSNGVVKFCKDIIALQPDECERYERYKSLEMDKDNDKDHIFRPENIVFVSHTENLNNRKCTPRLEDGTALTDFCRSLGIETCSNHLRTKQYAKYSWWFKTHNGEGHPELLKKANEVISTLSKCLKMLELLKDVRAFRAKNAL